MIGLSSTRVVVIDDEVNDAIPIMKALSKKNIASVFFNGDPKDFPEIDNKLYGIRLAILDMDLIGGTASPKSKVSTLVNTLRGILSPTNGPYAVIAWTKHPELLEEFEKYIYKENSVPNPVISIMMKKADAHDNEGNFSIDKISNTLDNELTKFSPLLILQSWEEQSFLSSIEVINLLSKLAVPDQNGDLCSWRETWRKQLLRLMHVVADEEAGKMLDELSSLRATFNSLGPLQADRLDTNSGRLAQELEIYHDQIVETDKNLDNDSRAKLNTMFHLAQDHLDKIAPGNIYIIDPYKKRPEWIPPRQQIFNDILEIKSNPNMNINLNRKKKIRQTIIEISPSCDHAQKNIRAARLLPGILIPVDIKQHFKKANFLYRFGPCYLNMGFGSGRYYYCFSARHFFTSSLSDLESLKPVFRFRAQAYGNLINWFSHHATRPGIMLLRPQKFSQQ